MGDDPAYPEIICRSLGYFLDRDFGGVRDSVKVLYPDKA